MSAKLICRTKAGNGSIVALEGAGAVVLGSQCEAKEMGEGRNLWREGMRACYLLVPMMYLVVWDDVGSRIDWTVNG
jgi:hypothetical protein